ncbi:response regulator transcription factor [Pararhizobium qamdonense]|uniref:response regulator transcription factor n=1 Tax=Pararhizobium qamdonense TaxID=3031126 RepID=UPI0023E23EAB|nr:response regulator transcription factor [Pararhizobium qamdonense]
MTLMGEMKVKNPIAILVDDDVAVCESLGNLLNSVGIDAVTYSSGHAFLSEPLPDRPACLILDVRMPGLSGLDLQTHLARNGVSTPIVFLTAHGDIAMSVQAMKAGAQDFLTKPVREQTFLDAVSKAIAIDISQRELANTFNKYVALFETLSSREREVLRMVVAGELNKQISHALKIQEVTVKLHRSNGMKKMQVTSFAQLFSAWQSLPSELRGQL